MFEMIQVMFILGMTHLYYYSMQQFAHDEAMDICELFSGLFMIFIQV